MTTPNQQTQIQLQDTQQAYQAFNDVVQALSPIAADANDYPSQIANVAMQSTAGTVFASCISEWIANFFQIWTVLGQITAQIEASYSAMTATNVQNNDLAGSMSEPLTTTPAATPATPAVTTPDYIAPQTVAATPATPAVTTPAFTAPQMTPATPAT